MTDRTPRESLARYQRNHRRAPERQLWQSGPYNAIDRAIDSGASAHEIVYELDVPKWLAVERFEKRAREAA